MATTGKINNPLAEVFIFPIINETVKAKRYRDKKLCPFNNKVPNKLLDKNGQSAGNIDFVLVAYNKGGIFQTWKKKQTVALQKSFFDTLPKLPTVSQEKADLAWFLYDLVLDEATKKCNLADKISS